MQPNVYSQLSANYALLFGGQGTRWVPQLSAAATLPTAGPALRQVLTQARAALRPVTVDLVTRAPGAWERLGDLLGLSPAEGSATVPPTAAGTVPAAVASEQSGDTAPAVCVPGIALAQLAALYDLQEHGFTDFGAAGGAEGAATGPLALLGHSQGILGVELARAWQTLGSENDSESVANAQPGQRLSQIIALAVLIGHAAQYSAGVQNLRATADATPMLSVSGWPEAQIRAALTEFVEQSQNSGGKDAATKDALTKDPVISVAVRNGTDALVLSGAPQDLAALREKLEAMAGSSETKMGAAPVVRRAVQCDWLRVDAPFHCPALASALEQVKTWLEQLGWDQATRQWGAQLAAQILTQSEDWAAQISATVRQGAQYFLDLGPSPVVGRLSEPLLEGAGAAIIDASTASARRQLAIPGTPLPAVSDWSRFAPSLVRLGQGKLALETAFTRLTGKSPIILPGMTPTTVDPEIVAAAANAGNWAEMAGGGQYSAQIFDENRQRLSQLLNPGCTAGFNTMFFDRFMWNLQFGVNKIVPKARRAGAPINAVTIAAGIPELEEAGQLIASLRADGFTYLCFKPGTVAQIGQVLEIARAHPDFTLIMQVEDGRAGGHHSWEDLDQLLLQTYSQVRATNNVVLTVGGGIARPADATAYLLGTWSQQYDRPAMPVDAVLVGTAAMACLEAKTSPQVKQLLKDTPGVGGDGWVGPGQRQGGMTSGLSHLGADLYEVANSSAAASALIHEIGNDTEAITARREEIIAALARTAKPYFGDLETMTYAEQARRFIALSHPWADWTWQDRALDLFRRIEARLNPADSGPIETLFPTVEHLADGPRALERLLAAYPQAETTKVSPSDAAWFPVLCRKHYKPLPFVPVLDGELARWWGTDTLWQSHDERFPADAVRIIPGPRSVAGIDRIDEPVGELFARFEGAAAGALAEQGAQARTIFARLGGAEDPRAYLRAVPSISWAGNLVDNPAYTMPQHTEIMEENGQWSIIVRCQTVWDQNGAGQNSTDQNSTDQNGAGQNNTCQPPHAVREIALPITLSHATQSGAVPVIDMARLSVSAYDLLAGAAGVGTVTVNGDHIDALPKVEKTAADEQNGSFGLVRYAFTLSEDLGPAHAQVTGAALRSPLAPIVPDALVGPCWPAIYAALGSAYHGGVPVIEGLVNAVHLDHTVRFVGPHTGDSQGSHPALPPAGSRIEAVARCAELSDSSAGRVVRVEVELSHARTVFAQLTERFAIRGRVGASTPPAPAPSPAGDAAITDTPRSFLRRVRVKAPADMTAFANISGDFNPIHTAAAAAGLSGLSAPLVHGMWLSATAQHLIGASAVAAPTAPPTLGVVRGQDTPLGSITGWTYQMHGMVNLGDTVEITLERVGRTQSQQNAGLNTDTAGASGVSVGESTSPAPVVEATCRIGGEIVSIGRAVLAAPRTAYVYPGQGIQRPGMGMEKPTPITREIWNRADRFTREKLGFSIATIVRDNPTEIMVGGQVLRHAEGVLNLTQFTQVALATLAYAQTQQLRADGAFDDSAIFAGHSLGEYNALACCAGIFPFEQVLEIVYQRGSAMHHLVQRDVQGRSNYRLGALRPNQLGLGENEVADFVEQMAQESGEFLQIVNLNLAGRQYAIAGTVAGLDHLAARATELAEKAGGKRPFMLIPGIDVPFHSRQLYPGVDPFREKLEQLIPTDLNYETLLGRYVPNLVARPFALTQDFARAITAVVPSTTIEQLLEGGWDLALRDPRATARTLLIELLAWQFASPVRWIETQDLLFDTAEAGGLGVQRVVEVGLGSAPTLANLATRTLQLARHRGRDVEVFNLERDAVRLLEKDSVPAPADDISSEDETQTGALDAPSLDNTRSASAGATEVSRQKAELSPDVSAPAVPSESPAAPADNSGSGAVSGAGAGEVPLRASEAIKILMAWANKLRVEQIEGADTVEVLTNGVSSKRNQLLMDMAAELGVPTIDGAAEASVEQLVTSVDSAAAGYQAFGPVLGEATNACLRKLFGSAGLGPQRVAQRVTETWQLPGGWAERASAQILLGTRAGDSLRGGPLATLPTSVSGAAGVDELIDTALTQVGAGLGINVTMPGGGGAGGAGGSGAVVDSQELHALSAKILGEDGVLAKQARHLLAELGIQSAPADPADETDPRSELAALASAIDAELGENWVESVKPTFRPEKAVLLDDRWALAREDLARVASGQLDRAQVSLKALRGAGQNLADLAIWYQKHATDPQLQDFFAAAAHAAADTKERHEDYATDVALITGAAPRSIAAQVVARLLAGGANVIMTTSRLSPARLAWAKDLYRQHATVGACLWLLEANMASLRDVDAVIDWIGAPYSETSGAQSVLVKPALRPTLFFPFAAPRVYGTLGSDPRAAMAQERLLLWSVERSIERLAALDNSTNIDQRVHVVLPGSPNRGIFGGDGAYGQAKAAFDTIVNKWSAESGWPGRITLAHPRIGWVQGTSLMGGNDVLVPAAQKAGIHVYTTSEIADALVCLASREARSEARRAPLEADLTGGLGQAKIDLAALAREASGQVNSARASAEENEENTTIAALPNLRPAALAAPLEWGQVSQNLADQVVIVGVGEVSAWGTGRTRHQAENGDGQVELTAAGVLELAWQTGLLHWSQTPTPGWYDAKDQPVDEAEIFARFRDPVLARCGIRELVDDATLVAGGSNDVATVYLQSPQSFTVQIEAEARAYVAADPQHTTISFDPATEQWLVTKAVGSPVRVPRRATLSRHVGGQLPTDFDPARWGIPANMIESLDRMAVWNLVTAVEAFVSSGFSPLELLAAVHPADVSSTQGTGIGGMESLRQVFLDRFLGEDRPSDILQEALPNVVAAHTMQSYVGGYGQMVHPVGACATAAVSIEDGADKIRLGKADFVVAGGIDDVTVESLTGFGDMNATAATDAMYARGISADKISRAGDRRRDGFLEASGGGTVLLARGSLAADLGLPVLGVVAYARSFADGAHTSIPAPGVGALAAGRGGRDSALARSLADLGVGADDIAVVSKHDTSTKANDPNEAELHSRLCAALGRTPGNPLYVISQKTLTGHAKGGAAVFQTAGLLEVFRDQVIPGNRALDCLDPEMRPWQPLLWLRRPLDTSACPVRAGVLSSLGFGHVAALVVLVHPGAFEAALATERGQVAASEWRGRAQGRLAAGVSRLEQAMLGREPLFEPAAGRRLPAEEAHAVEVAMLLDPAGRLGADGIYGA